MGMGEAGTDINSITTYLVKMKRKSDRGLYLLIPTTPAYYMLHCQNVLNGEPQERSSLFFRQPVLAQLSLSIIMNLWLGLVSLVKYDINLLLQQSSRAVVVVP